MSTMVQTHDLSVSSKKLHPFFAKPPADESSLQPDSTTKSIDGNSSEQRAVDYEQSDDRRKRRKHSSDDDSSLKIGELPCRDAGSQLPSQLPVPGPTPGTAGEPTCSDTAVKFEQNSAPQNGLPHTRAPRISENIQSTLGQELDSTPRSSTDNVAAVPTEANKDSPPSKTQKVLRFNTRTGTLGSPPKPKPTSKPSRLVCIRYGKDEASRKRIGDAITNILNGSLRIPDSPTTPTRKKRGRPRRSDQKDAQTSSTQQSHPFFTGKGSRPAARPATTEPPKKSPKSRNTIFMSTPVSPRKPRVSFNISGEKVPRFGSKGTGGTKIPGAMHPMWPAQGMSHVLGNELKCASFVDNASPETSRKFKGQVVTVSEDESVLASLRTSLSLAQIRAELPRNEDEFTPVPAELRLPVRHFESGRKLRARITPQLKSLGAVRSSSNELDSKPSTRGTPPAISRLYKSLETQLSAYDRSTCETLIWTQKYAPRTAAEVLQVGKEGPLLRTWLEALKVQTVHTGPAEATSKAKGKAENGPRKRKKNKLDGFIVDSEDELAELGDLSDDQESTDSEALPAKKTLVRSGDSNAAGAGRLQNVVLLSGPHGCGKTAAVYAVAKELDFEIFEINASARRSGKDIMEKVGDMTRNHLVQQHRAEKSSLSGTGDGETDDETAKDVKSGKQGTMMSFFKPNPNKPTKTPTTASKADGPPKSSASKSQKQSLILIEEADVMYEEDKQFWTTLMSMISQSKRPFILTCNDESLVPTQGLPLHGIFRFSPAPTDLAVDLCLLIAANEGHALQRNAVEAAYASRGNDLRATILDLNYWCQLGIGDRRGGFDWFYLRWPKGCDIDQDGDTVRVVSENTYSKGFGWIGRDPLIASHNALETDEEALQQAWNFWEINPDHHQGSTDLQPWARDISSPSLDQRTRLEVLSSYDDFCEVSSVADLCAPGSFGSHFQQHIDAALPDLPSKAREDYILGRTLLEAEPLVPQSCPGESMSHCLNSLGRRVLLERTEDICITSSSSLLEPLDETRMIQALSSSFESSDSHLTRYDIALAFDPLATSDKAPASHLDPSVFDRPMKPIVLDVAPFVRSIVAFDNKLMQERAKLSTLLSEGGSGGGGARGRKRMRTTRAAYSALEGGERKTTRRERYFDGIATGFVLRTAGEGWVDAGIRAVDEMRERITQQDDAAEEVVQAAEPI